MDTLRVRALKYGNRPHYEWTTNVLARHPDFLVCWGKPGRTLTHHTKQRTFTVEGWSVEFFSLREWFTVSLDLLQGQVAQYYCNIAKPAQIAGATLSFVDLDLDLVRRPGKEWEVLDEDELKANALRLGYPEALVLRARAELEGLRARVRFRGFPFDGTLDPYVQSVAEQSLRGVDPTHLGK